MGKKTGYIHLYISGSIQILSKSQYRIDINNAGIVSKLPLIGFIEKKGVKTVRFQYDDTKISIDDMLITYQVTAGFSNELSLSQGVLKASNVESIDFLSKKSNSIYIKSTKTATELNKDMEQQVRIAACDHKDGAIQVAQYIVNEIRANVNSLVAHRIRYHLTGELSNELENIFDRADSSMAKISEETGHPIPGANHKTRSRVTAFELWIGQVNTGKPWDHKNKIRENFGNIAVQRPLPPPSNTWSETYYHKYKDYDYYLDIWSNIHYGYVGRSVGFTRNELMKGSDVQQKFKEVTSGNWSGAGDTKDDETAMLIGIDLYEKYSLSKNVTTYKILDEIVSKENSKFPISKVKHYCLR